jgi:DNA-directed RNA polymerase subunit omega
MARVTVEDCMEVCDNRFALVLLAARRTRQLMKGGRSLVYSKNKAAVTSLREIASHKVYYSKDIREVVQQYIDERKT